MPETFSIGDSLRFAWGALWREPNRRVLLFSILTILALDGLRVVLLNLLSATAWIWGLVALVVLAEIVVGIGFTAITLAIAREQKVRYRNLFPSSRTTVRYIAANLLAALITCLGFLCLILPGVYFLIQFSMVKLLALDQDTDAFAILSRGSQLTAGVKWRLCGFFLLLIGINVLGALLALLGLLVTIPLSLIAYARVYLWLRERTDVV